MNESGYNRKNVVEVYGNHDMWGIIDYNPNEEYSALYTIRDQSDFYSFITENDDIRVIGFNPQDFPTAHGPFQFVAQLRKKMLDSLENKLNQPTNAKYTIVSTHFPQEVIANFDSCKSSSGYCSFISSAFTISEVVEEE